jgi:hypothetical protein
MLAALELTSGVGAVIALIVLSLLFLLWIISLFLLVTDTIGFGAKVLWFVFLTCLAPITIPVYFLVRARRGGQAAPAR